ncbi:MAG: 4Fe-4S dicluster domain-containing protein [Syntrophales bacterium]|jgi:heterodisulfide reductase subunit C|nr:4Fe-4S dicluster domain-containing protein [Syntrophales bacterium]MCK9528555.1 4Fe-4S dicluster domain-containing protein [Syntrophales bacterium]MDX9922818.1 4Fe-4S dicluster domain-containing protein [Syntrophales bacterium]
MEGTNKTASQVKRDAAIYGCVECGRCVGVCPMAQMYKTFSIVMSPRGIIKRALMGEDLLHDKNLWYCTECNAGTDVCPQGVSCRDLIRGMRNIALREGAVDRIRVCAHCGDRFVAVPVEDFVISRLAGEVPRVLELLKVCPACRRNVYVIRNA